MSNGLGSRKEKEFFSGQTAILLTGKCKYVNNWYIEVTFFSHNSYGEFTFLSSKKITDRCSLVLCNVWQCQFNKKNCP